MDFNKKNNDGRRTASMEGDKDESLNAVYIEVVDSPTMTPALLYDTEATIAMTSNMDHTVTAENKSDMGAIDSSKTREFPDVFFGKILAKGIFLSEKEKWRSLFNSITNLTF